MIRFFFQDCLISLKNRNNLKVFISNIFNIENKKYKSLNFIFCTDEYLLQINNDFLKHNYFTDIITFNLSESKKLIEGEIYISIDRVKENAKRQTTTLTNELHRVIFHGALHLCGYKDKTKKEVIKMRNREDYYLSLYFS